MLRTLLAALTSLAGSSGAWAAGLDGRSSGDPTTWRETIDLVLEMVATGIEVTGVAIIVIAAVVSTALFVSAGISSIGWPQAFRTYRANSWTRHPPRPRTPRRRRHHRHRGGHAVFRKPRYIGPDRADQDIPELLTRSRDRGALALAAGRGGTHSRASTGSGCRKLFEE